MRSRSAGAWRIRGEMENAGLDSPVRENRLRYCVYVHPVARHGTFEFGERDASAISIFGYSDRISPLSGTFGVTSVGRTVLPPCPLWYVSERSVNGWCLRRIRPRESQRYKSFAGPKKMDVRNRALHFGERAPNQIRGSRRRLFYGVSPQAAKISRPNAGRAFGRRA